MKRVHLIEQSRFARDLAGLLRIGYPAVEAVEKLEKSRDDSLRPVLERAVGKMHAGSSFSESIKDESALLPLFLRLRRNRKGFQRGWRERLWFWKTLPVERRDASWPLFILAWSSLSSASSCGPCAWPDQVYSSAYSKA